jgi:hypothetical protein
MSFFHYISSIKIPIREKYFTISATFSPVSEQCQKNIPHYKDKRGNRLPNIRTLSAKCFSLSTKRNSLNNDQIFSNIRPPSENISIYWDNCSEIFTAHQALSTSYLLTPGQYDTNISRYRYNNIKIFLMKR